MTYLSVKIEQIAEYNSRIARSDPRWVMYNRLPRWIQPFLTWLTARPGPDEMIHQTKAMTFFWSALLWIVSGVSLTILGMWLPLHEAVIFCAVGLLFTCSGLGLFQVVVFHHCSHGTVFRTRERNRLVGRWISALLLFKNFDAYQREHMLHHSANKLLTEEDEFADFVFLMCRLAPEVSKRELWLRVLIVLVSPNFHVRFLRRRIQASLASADRTFGIIGCVMWSVTVAIAIATGQLLPFLLAWVLPVTVLLQIATVFRILCEHRFPPPELIAARGKEFVCRSTSGVFPGSMPPRQSCASAEGLWAWSLWWLNMLMVQLFVRLFVLVGDAPCHDYHHRRPATRKWTNYIHARQQDVDAGCPGFPLNYGESWGLFRAIDENLATLADTPRSAVFHGLEEADPIMNGAILAHAA